ncbi:uncharacterized protein EDB91DRAFT_1250043 [Suillus paluster]|uniref:uncharacterized protein n=1 Tax=Suillus paluster TaxID=48578 RepID=UPI001B872D49|nr:uncharacterized protein EDB91DRAFT_1250043 [Suillus paluster]KAG1736417.1 hypothetical protein EDB91DRAFT_1250043 [Suillus paluster]
MSIEMAVTNLAEEDVIALTIQDAGLAHNFYNQNAAALDLASDDVAVINISKKNATNFLGEAKKLMDALDVLQQVHPFASDMMTMLLQLKDTGDPAIVGPHGEIRGRLQRVTDSIKIDIEDCGNAIDKYYKSKFIGLLPSEC